MRLGLVLLGCVLVFVGCSQPLESLLPANASAVVLVQQPVVLKSLAPLVGNDFPWKSVDFGRPWAAAVLPGDPPGILWVVPIDRRPDAWLTWSQWTQVRGGFHAVRVGDYAVMTTPGVTWGGPTPIEKGYSLQRLRQMSDPVALEVQTESLLPTWPAVFRDKAWVIDWLSHNIRVVTFGLGPDEQGLHLTAVVRESHPETASGRFSDAVDWTRGLEASHGFQATVSLRSADWNHWIGLLPDAEVSRQFKEMIPLLGSRVLFQVLDGTVPSWSIALATSDPMGLRQAIRTLIAGGSLQRLFPYLAWDPDTPILYRDAIESGHVRGEIRVGPSVVLVSYVSGRVLLASGPRAAELLAKGETFPDGPSNWAINLPRPAQGIFRTDWRGLVSRSSLRETAVGQWQIDVRISGDSLSALTSEFPQRVLGWLQGSVDSSPGRP